MNQFKFTSLDGWNDFTRKATRIIAGRGIWMSDVEKVFSEYGQEMLSYQLSGVSKTIIALSVISGSQVVISAKDTAPDPHIAFLEFGTGIIGKTKGYVGALPTYWEYDSHNHGTNGWDFIKGHTTNDMLKGSLYHTQGLASRHPVWNTRDNIKFYMHELGKQGTMNFLLTIL